MYLETVLLVTVPAGTAYIVIFFPKSAVYTASKLSVILVIDLIDLV